MQPPDALPFPYRQQVLGWFAVLGSSLCFYLATVVIRWSKSHVDIQASFYVLARFLLGFAVVCISLLLSRQRVNCTRMHFIIGRTVTNALAVYCFYKAVEVSTVANANILNMTYPLFVAMFSWLLLREKQDWFALGVVLVAALGIWLILIPGHRDAVRFSDHWGLLSGLFAGVSIIYLNLSRKHHDSQTILFFMFGPGALLTLPLCLDALFVPGKLEWFFLLSCSFFGVLGQYLLTYGFLYVTAVEGAVISSSRIVIAALLGPLLVADPQLTVTGWLGALILFGANVALALRRQKHLPESRTASPSN